MVQLPHEVPPVPEPVAGEKDPVPGLQFWQPEPKPIEYFPALQLPHKSAPAPWPMAGENDPVPAAQDRQPTPSCSENNGGKETSSSTVFPLLYLPAGQGTVQAVLEA